MSLIFLSHSAVDEIEALAVKEWLTENGWADVFLDIDPQRGLAAGERWQEALRRAADRCEAVVFLVSPAWAKSKWCLTEFLLAKSLNKRVFGTIVKDIDLAELPNELTAEWQLTHLTGAGPKTPIRFSHKGHVHTTHLLTDGLVRLRTGLQTAGLDARYFAWPPPDDRRRSPYRGLEALEETDAAVYFGRDAQVVRGMDALRGMRGTGVETLFVILGPSGCGKSSFLRAGLLPRLKRDERHFAPLETIRPERNAITGERGLANAIHKAKLAFGLRGATLASIKTALTSDGGGLSPLLAEVWRAAHDRLRVGGEGAPAPTLLLPIDQAEELFSSDATDEARQFLALLGAALHDTSNERAMLIAAFSIRSDRYEPLQTAPELAGLKGIVFDDLKPMPSQQFKEVILGPARRATDAGHRLEIEPSLVDKLLLDCAQGADTLPMLSMTLSRLYRDYGDDGNLLLAEYEAMGGMGSVVNSEIESVLASDLAEHEAQLGRLHSAFVPWLASIDPESDEPIRRLARYDDLPDDSRYLIDILIEKRLLLVDQREGDKIIEVAHEALLRRWNALAAWLLEERDDLRLAHDIEQAAQDWYESGRNSAWLWSGERIANAAGLLAKLGFSKRLEGCHEFLLASRDADNLRRDEEERGRQAQLMAARDKQAASEALAQSEKRARVRQQRFTLGLSGALVLAIIAAFLALRSQRTAASRALAATAANRVATAPAVALALSLEAIAASPTVEALGSLRQALSVSRLQAILHHSGPVNSARFDSAGRRVVTGSDDALARVWDAATGRVLVSLVGHAAAITAATFDPSGRLVVTASEDSTARVWDAVSGKQLLLLNGHTNSVNSAEFRPDGQRIVTAGDDGTVRVWDSNTGREIALMSAQSRLSHALYDPSGAKILVVGNWGTVLADGGLQAHVRLTNDLGFAVAFSRNGQILATAVDSMSDGTALVWSTNSAMLAGARPIRLPGHQKFIIDLDLDSDGRHLAVASDDNSTRVWDIQHRTFLSLIGHQFDVSSIRFNRQGTLIVTGGDDGTARVWNAGTGTMVATLSGHSAQVELAEFNQNGTQIVTASSDSTARIWRTDFVASPIVKDLDFAGQVTLARDGSRALIGYADGMVRTWSLRSGTLAQPLQACPGDFLKEPEARFDSSEKYVWTSCDSVIRKWQVRSARKDAEWWLPSGFYALASSFGNDTPFVLARSEKGELHLFKLGKTTQLAIVLAADTGTIRAALGARDSLAATATRDGRISIWNLRNGNLLGELPGHAAAIPRRIAYNADGSRLAAGDWSKTTRVWDVRSRKLLAVLEHGSAVFGVNFSPDGRFLATGEQNGTVRVWEVPSGTLVMSANPHKFPVNDISFTADATGIVTASNDGSASFFPCYACGNLRDVLERGRQHLPAEDGASAGQK